MLTEDDVVDEVRDYLIGQRWRIVPRATALQRGIDLVAERDVARLEVEAKGAGSSKLETARYGKYFSKAQVFDHVAKAVLKELRVTSVGTSLAAIALPDNPDHRNEVKQVSLALDRASIGVFWVSESGAVLVEAPWA